MKCLAARNAGRKMNWDLIYLAYSYAIIHKHLHISYKQYSRLTISYKNSSPSIKVAAASLALQVEGHCCQRLSEGKHPDACRALVVTS